MTGPSSCARLLRLALAAYFGENSSARRTRCLGVFARSLCSPPTFRRLGLAWVGHGWTKLERYILDEPFFGVSQVLSDLITSWVGCKSTRRAVISCFTWSDLVWTLPIFFTWKQMRFGRATSQVVFHVFLDPGSVALESLLVRRWTCQQT